MGGFHIACAIFLGLAMGLNIAIMVVYGKLPRYNGCCCCPPTAYTQRTFLYTNGPIQQYGVQPPVEMAQVIQLPNGQQVIYQNQGTWEIHKKSESKASF